MKWIISLAIGLMLSINAIADEGKCRKNKEFISCEDIEGSKKVGFCLTKNRKLPEKKRISFCKRPSKKK